MIDLLRAHFSRPEAWEQLGVTVIDGQHPSISQQREATPGDEPPADGLAAAGAYYGNLPVSFEANEGQTDERVHYLSRGPGYNFYLMSQGAVLVNSSFAELPASARAVLGIEFAGASSSPTVKGVERLESKSHYLMGNNPDRWRINVPHYAKVHYQQVYPGVDLVYYGREGELRFDFVVAPGADPNQIGLVFRGVEHLEIDEQGDLSLVRAEGRLEIEKPFVYQQVDGTKQQIAGDYVIGNHGRVRFELAAYDETLPLVIDPVLSYSSYLGGRGEDGIQSIAVDAAGNAYVTGATTSADLPIEGTETAFAGGGEFSSDIFVTKFNADGTALLYSAFIGGSDDDIGEGIAVDGEGNAYITGATRSADFPTTEAAQTDFAGGGAVFGTDAFVVKLDPMGAVMYSGYLGGADDDGGAAVAVDSEGNSYVAGFTASVDFPVRNALQPANAGGRPFGSDAFVVKLNPTGTAIVYGSYLGGSGDDAANGVAVDDASNAYLTGVTFSADFPTANPFQQPAGGSADAFVAKVNAAGSALVYSTYLGGESDDMGMGLVVDGAGNAYVTGITGSADFPLLNAVQAELGGGTPLGFDAFVAKLNAAGSALAYSTYLGGAGIEAGLGIALDPGGNVYVVGEANSSDFPTENPLQLGSGGLNDSFVVKLNPSGSAFDYSTYFGGDDDDSATSVAVDDSGNAYIAGLSRSTDAPATFGAFQTNTAGEADALIAKIVAGTPLPAVTTVSAASFSGSLGASPESIVSDFGAGLAGEKAEAEAVPLPTVLAGTSVKVTDSTRTERLAALFFVSASQINYLIPEGTETGLALVNVERDGQVVASGTVQINPVAPALFSADSSGQGVAAALFLRVAADQSRSEDLIFDPNSRASVPIDLGPDGDRIFLLLFGTGVRGFTAEVTATVGGESVPVLGALPQPEFLGLDQINIGPLPRSLAGRGEVNILLTADGKPANTVTVNVR